MTPLPKEPTGGHALEQTIKQLIRCVRERTIIPTPGVRVSRGNNGTALAIEANGKGRSSPSGDEPVWL
jgi:hypothetical protein